MKIVFSTLLIAVATLSYAQTKIENKKSTVIFDMSGGLSSRIGTAKETGDFILDNKIKASRNGYFIDASLYVQLKPEMNHYVGIKYHNFFDFVNEEKLAINFYAISYLYSKELTSHDLVNLSSSLGYISYKDDEYFTKGYTIKGGTVGFGLEGSYLLKISKAIYSGPKIGFQFGKISDFDVSSKNNSNENISLRDEEESVSTFNIGLVLRVKI